MQRIQLKYSKSLGGGFEGDPKDVWGCIDYTDRTKPCVFVGMYDFKDYLALWRHKGKAWIFWCGGDVLNLSRGFLLNDGKLKWLSKILPGFKFILKKILKKTEHWVENHVERDALFKWGIEKVFVAPSYFGDINLPVTYEWNKNPKVYVSCSGNQQLYGWGVIERIAPGLPMIDFYLYGADWDSKCKNIHVRGIIPKEQMNKETSIMQASLRLNESDGFSELVAKAILRGQYCVSRIPYPLIQSYKTEEELIEHLRSLTIKYKPNLKARDFYRKVINQFPFNKNYDKD